MKLVKTVLATAVAAVAFSATTQAEVTTNIAVSSDYVWRGVSQTYYGSSVSGGIDYADESGFYAGAWASNTGYGGGELDLYAGFAGEAGDFGYSIGYLLYAYPTVDDYNFGEITLDFSYDILSFGMAYTIHSDWGDGMPFVEGDVYLYAGASFDLGNDWSLGLTAGYYDFDNDGVDNDGAVLESYGHVQVDLGKSYGDWGDFAFSVSLAEEGAADPNVGFSNNENADQPLFFVTWAKGF
ncbi:TorF family putative porin [Halioxenophilus aromaticivorans]|uniref:Histidine kinase n=1 Tax=Halioxenophilus aromaticivorans TaxID=1306992 RepID=A0AAV3U545_9ALTE